MTGRARGQGWYTHHHWINCTLPVKQTLTPRAGTAIGPAGYVVTSSAQAVVSLCRGILAELHDNVVDVGRFNLNKSGGRPRKRPIYGCRLHHTRKNAAGGVAAGQGLPGSSDLHAFGDSNLYVRRSRERLVLSSEHRAAAAPPPVYLELVATSTDTAHLEVTGELEARDRRHLEQQVLDLLTGGVVLTRAKLRDTLSVKNERVGDVLQSLERTAQLRRTATGWQRVQ